MAVAMDSTLIKILVVDDDDVDRERITRLLKKAPFETQICEGTSAQEALTLLSANSFHCAILDYQLQDSLGSELVKFIKRKNSITIPIIMISGNGDERLIANVMRDGVFDYLPKKNLAADNLQQAIQEGLKWANSENFMREQRARFYQLAEGLPQLIWTCLPDGSCDFLNRRWCEYTGADQEEQLGDAWLNHLHPDDRIDFISAWQEAISQEKNLNINLRIRDASGTYRVFDTRATAQRDETGKIIRWLGSNTDINELETTRQALMSSERQFHAAFDHAPIGMALVDLQGKILQVNSAMHSLIKADYDEIIDDDFMVGKQLDAFSVTNHINHEQELLDDLLKKDIQLAQFEKQLISSDNHEIYTQANVAIIHNNIDEPYYLYQFYDLSERKRHEEQLIQLAHFDSLTGLGNRVKLQQEIDYLVNKCQRNATPFALLFGDLDEFKQINDSFGHDAGDYLLRIVAKRIKKILRRGDSVSRLGGDEFVILLQDVTKFESVVTVVEKLILSIKKPMRIEKNIIHIGVSFGIALYPTDGENAKTLLRNADSALYEAKNKGRGSYQLYRKELTEYVHNRLMLDNDMRHAIKREEFELHYQPVLDLHTKKIISVEALIRWNHPTRGLVPPDNFIPFAQDSGLINPIGEWVIKEACNQGATWHQQGIKIAVAVNVSSRQFNQNNLISIIKSTLVETLFDPHYLTIEITEQMFLENTIDNVRQIQELKALGIKIALDDFGTGFSSLGYIIRFAPNFVKIDRSFVNKIGVADEHDAMIDAIINLDKIMPMTIVAEGIETEAQEHYLLARGCELGQGYKYSKPLKAELLAPIFDQFGTVDT